MKKHLPIAFTTTEKNLGRLISLFFCIMMSLNLSAQKIHTLLSETWTSGNWQKASLLTYSYDGSGYLINLLTQTWDVPSLSWKNGSQSNYTNNPDGTANVVIVQMWDGVSAWNNTQRMTYTYNTSKKVLTKLTENWLSVIWQNSALQTNSYDGSGYLTNILTQSWDGVSAWNNSAQINYTNDGNGNATQAITQTWVASAWNNTTRVTSTYNGSNKVVTEVSDTWVASAWQPSSRDTYTYDGSGFLIKILSESWDSGSSSWKNNNQSNFTNNTDGTPSVIITQQWDATNSVWNNAARSTFTYSVSTLTQEFTIDESAYKIYPNPTVNYFKIQANTNIDGLPYSITDQSGKLVLTGRLINDNAIDISTLRNGIYFIHVGDSNTHSYKIIKNK